MCRYMLNAAEKGVVKSSTGEIMRPSCYDDLNAYYNYLISTGEDKQAHELLKNVFAGEKVISKMVKKMQSVNLEVTGVYPTFNYRG